MIEKFEIQRRPALESIENKAAIQHLESMENVRPHEKKLILATALGFKPASHLELNPSSPEQAEAEAVRFEKTLHDLDLLHKKIEWLRAGRPGSLTTEYVIAKKQETIDEFMRFIQSPERYHFEFGMLMGFPPTAVEAYERGEAINLGEKYDYAPEERAFLFFAPSKDNVREELAWLHTIIAEIKRISPRIYEDVMSYMRGIDS